MGCVSSKALKGKKAKDGSEYQKVCILKGEEHAIPQKTLPEIWKELLETNKDLGSKAALIYEDKETTFEDLDKQTDALAKVLLKEIKAEGSDQPVVGVLMPPSDSRIITLLAIIKAQMQYLPLENNLPNARLQHFVKTAKANAVITTKGYVDTSEILTDESKLLNFEDLVGQESEENLPDNSEKNPAVTISFTSGSTGVPQGVPIKTRNILNRLMWQWDQFPYEEQDVACQKTSLLFIDSLTEIFGALMKGVPLVVASPHLVLDPEEFIAFLDKHKITRLILVPTFLQSILNSLEKYEKGTKLESLRTVVSSGEELPVSVALDFFEKLPGQRTLLNLYGSAEVTGDVTFEVYANEGDVKNKTMDNHISIGLPIWNTSVYVMDDNMKPIKSGETGELYICGMPVCGRYLGEDKAERLKENPHSKSNDDSTLYQTGDFVSVVSSKIIYRGRTDNMLKIRGQRFDLSEVDRVVGEVNGVKECATLAARPLKDSLEIVAFYCTDEENVEDLEKNINKSCEEFLPSFAQPRLHRVPELPLLAASGKVDRQQLLKQYIDPAKAVIENEIETVQATVTELMPDKPEIERYVTKTETKVVKTIRTDGNEAVETIKKEVQTVRKEGSEVVETIKKEETREVSSGLMGGLAGGLGNFLSSDSKTEDKSKKDEKDSGLMGGLSGFLGGSDSKTDKSDKDKDKDSGLLGGLGGFLSSDKKSGGGGGGGMLDSVKATVGTKALDMARQQAEKFKSQLAEKYPMLKNIPLDAVFRIISEKLGISPASITPDSSVFNLGANSSTAAEMVSAMRDEGVSKASVKNLLGTANVGEFLGTLVDEGAQEVTDKYASNYETWVIDENVDYDQLADMQATAYMKKHAPIAEIATHEGIKKLFLENKQLVIDSCISCYIVDTRTNKNVACSINYDLQNPFQAVEEVETLLSFLDQPAKELIDFVKGKYGQDTRWLQSFSNVVDVNVNPAEALYLMKLMDEETVNYANNRGYDGIVACNFHTVAKAVETEVGFTVHKTLNIQDAELNGKKIWPNLNEEYLINESYLHIDYDDESPVKDEGKSASNQL